MSALTTIATATFLSREWCERCGGGMVRNGQRTVCFADINPQTHIGMRVHVAVQRMICRRCRAVVHHDCPRLVEGTRVTHGLAGIIVDEVLAGSGHAVVARRHGLQARTVRTLWNLAVRNAREKTMVYPGLARLLPLPLMTKTAICLRDENGRAFDAFTGPADTRLLDWMGGHPGGLLLVHPRLWLDGSGVVSRLDIACDRLSVLRMFEVAIGGSAGRARRWMDRNERRALVMAWPIILKPTAARSPEEDDTLDELASVHHRLDELRAAVDGLRASMRTSCAERAHMLVHRWQASLTSFGSDVFSPVLSLLGRVRSTLFGQGWNARVQAEPSLSPANNLASIGHASLMLARGMNTRPGVRYGRDYPVATPRGPFPGFA